MNSEVLSELRRRTTSGKFRQIVDFSDLREVGEYAISVSRNNEITSSRFIIDEHPYRELTRKALRAFYYQRASMPIEEPYAEGFARPTGHPDDHVIVHALAATDERPEGTIISSPGGWYDAGDYNKYIVNSGYTMGVWLMAYELNKAYFDTLNLNIPESPMGEYDEDLEDFDWAATELYLLTKDDAYKQMALDKCPETFVPAVWGNVAELANLDLLMHGEISFLSPLTSYLSPFMEEAEGASVHRCPYGNREEEFFWGCNSEGCCWRGVECLYAYRLTGEEKYRINAERCLNYILGQNSTGYCYVTGFGSKPTSHPHHRLSYSHPKGTHPGFLAGGPNRMRQDAETDGVKYPKNVPADESYLDEQPSYASNEVTINWNVTLFALTAGLDALE